MPDLGKSVPKKIFVIEKKIVEQYQTIYDDIIGTIYHPEKKQTDNTPLITADLSKINPKKINELRWIAMSRDLINQQDKIRKWYGKVKFGDTVYIESPKDIHGNYKFPYINGKWVLHDTMNKRYKNRIDFLQDKNGLYGKWNNLIIKKIIRKEIKYIKIINVIT